ncbi:type IV pilus modification PilV family protein [Ferrimonas gelatinilytica]|uniref:Prepilin-type N-terminal cleavage/methylation domain-containing protein n=1 Tax=Ferrimonas gelatinilytica TaxID=1255257 RepID=A0ABP9SE10_9GAMM
MTTRRYSQGFGLIEILVAVLIIGLGVVALTTLQGKFIKSSAATSQREVALKLAQAKVDDLRSFTYIKPEEEDVPLSERKDFAFGEIIDDQGGRASELGAGTGIRFENHSFSLGWSVTDYKLEGGTFIPTTAADDVIARKHVVVKVGWTTATGNEETISLSHTLAPTAPDTGTAVSGGDAGFGGPGPTVMHQDAEAPDVIDFILDDGTGTKRETSKPIPSISSRDGIVLVQFDSVNFINSDSQGKVTQEDYMTVGCNCRLAPDGQKKDAENPVQLEWFDGEVMFTRIGLSNKLYGTYTPPSGATVTPQMAKLCNRCCEDHFDAGTLTDNGADRLEKHYSYDKNRWSSVRYKRNELGVFVAATPNEDFLAACRMQRIDGFYRLMPDWQQVHVELMTRSYLENEGVVEQYQKLVTDSGGILRRFASSATNYRDAPASFEFTSYPSGVTSFPQNQVYLDPNSGRSQLLARSIYVDPLESYPESVSEMSLLSYPFHEVNATLLSDWALYSCGSQAYDPSIPLNGCIRCEEDGFGIAKCGNVNLTNEPVASGQGMGSNDYYSDYFSRGELSYQTSATGNYVVELTTRMANSSLTGLGAVSPYDSLTLRRRYLAVSFDEAPADTINIGGWIQCIAYKATGTNNWPSCGQGQFDVTVSLSDGTICPVQPKLQGQQTPAFSCNVPMTWLDDDANAIVFTNNKGDVLATFAPEINAALVRDMTEVERIENCVAMIVNGEGQTAPNVCGI